MKKKLLTVVTLLVLGFALTGCWAGEIGVTTVFNQDGSGTRSIVVDIMDDTLSETPIVNPDDPEGTEGKGAVVNNKHITGGLLEIQTWLTENAPDFITVEPVRTEGYHRYFTLTYSWDNFEEFLQKYEALVDLSPTLSWSDFTDAEKPTLEKTGLFNKTLTFKESKVLVEASLDWAIDGIWNDIYDAADLGDYVTKADITVLAGYTVTILDGKYEELPYYDEDALEGDQVTTGATVYVQAEDFEVSGVYADTTVIIVSIVAGVVLIGGAVFAVLKLKK